MLIFSKDQCKALYIELKRKVLQSMNLIFIHCDLTKTKFKKYIAYGF